VIKDWKPRQKPNLLIGGLHLWVRGREFPESQDYWDGNWLNVVVYCRSQNSNVWITGPVIHLSELEKFQTNLEELINSSKRIAILETMEPHLKLEFENISEKRNQNGGISHS
jgi:hypothetical protein